MIMMIRMVIIRAVNGYPGVWVPVEQRVPGSKISTRVGMVGPPVVINTSRLAKMSAAMKSCTYSVVVAQWHCCPQLKQVI